MATINDMIKLGKDEDGYLEKSRAAYNKDHNVLWEKKAGAGYDNGTKYAYELDQIPNFFNGKKNWYAWCCVFVSWLFVKTFGVERARELLNYPKNSLGAVVDYMKRYFTNKNQYYHSPAKGDVIFFRNAKGGMTHVGLVYDFDSKYVYTIEGNTSGGSTIVAEGGAVCLKKYSLSNTGIDGYGRPAYSDSEKESSGKEEKYIYNTDWEGLNVRETPNGKILYTLPVGTKVYVSETSGQWSHIDQGWVFSAYLSSTRPDVREITSKELNVRKGPGIGYGIITTLKQGTKVQIYKISGSWAKVSPNKSAWCSKNYLR